VTKEKTREKYDEVKKGERTQRPEKEKGKLYYRDSVGLFRTKRGDGCGEDHGRYVKENGNMR
jgi:hypothetical protein